MQKNSSMRPEVQAGGHLARHGAGGRAGHGRRVDACPNNTAHCTRAVRTGSIRAVVRHGRRQRRGSPPFGVIGGGADGPARPFMDGGQTWTAAAVRPAATPPAMPAVHMPRGPQARMPLEARMSTAAGASRAPVTGAAAWRTCSTRRCGTRRAASRPFGAPSGCRRRCRRARRPPRRRVF